MQFIDTIDVKGLEYLLQATYDALGNDIANTYAKITEVEDTILEAIDNLIDGAPVALDTLKEISAALQDDADYAATITNELAKKANVDDVYNKEEIGQIKSEINSSIVSQVNTLSGEILKRAYASEVYTKTETYNKDEVNAIAITKANASDSYTKDLLYTKTEVDEAFNSLREDLPTKVSEFENDAEYLVWSQVEHFAEAKTINEALDTKVDKAENMGLISNENTIKLLALPTAAQYEELMLAYQKTLSDCTDAVQAMGTNIDGAMQKNDELDIIISEQGNAIAALQTNKVDIVEGMGLSSNDYTAEDKELLQDLSERVITLETAIAVLEQFETLTTKVAELETKIAELEAKHTEIPEESSEPEVDPEA